MDTQELNTALSKAKIALMSQPDSTFFTTICFSLKFKWDDTCPTAYTNGTVLGFNPKFFMSMPPEERVGVMVHEAMHVAYLHTDRLEDRDRSIFNQAADHVINLQLLERNFKLPAMRLADPRFKGMSTEEVYKILMDEKSKGKPNTPNPMEDLQSSEMPSPDLQQAVQDILVRAQIQSKMAGDKPGSIPGDIEIFLDNLLNPKLPWKKILSKYMQQFSKSDYSMRMPNRRFFPRHHLPSLYSESLMDLACFVDISGSVTDEEFHVQVSETASILRNLKPSKILFGQFDTDIKSVTKIKNLMELSKVTFTGRGGTYISPVLEWAEKNKPQLLLIFSDGGFNFYEGMKATCPVLWIIYNNPGFEAPFGKVIHYSI